MRATFRLTFVLSAIALLWAAPAIAKPKIAVLGLEVADDKGSPDLRINVRAKWFTATLRAQAARGAGKFELAPNSEKDLLEMKLLSDCAAEAPDCMAGIGRELRADRLLYGKIERQADGFRVSLHLLDTASATVLKRSEIAVPFKDSEEKAIPKYAARIYGRLTGDEVRGSLIITVSNANNGTVYLDDKVATSLADGAATLSELSEGKHTVMVEAPGFTRGTKDVVIEAGQTSSLEITLLAEGPGSDDRGGGGGGRGTYKAVSIGSTVLGLGAGAYWLVEYMKIKDSEDSVDTLVAGFSQADRNLVSEEDLSYCAKAKTVSSGNRNANIDSLLDECARGDNASSHTYFAIPATAILGVTALVTGYLGWFSDSDSRSEQAAAKAGQVKLETLITPQAVSAGVKITF